MYPNVQQFYGHNRQADPLFTQVVERSKELRDRITATGHSAVSAPSKVNHNQWVRDQLKRRHQWTGHLTIKFERDWTASFRAIGQLLSGIARVMEADAAQKRVRVHSKKVKTHKKTKEEKAEEQRTRALLVAAGAGTIAAGVMAYRDHEAKRHAELDLRSDLSALAALRETNEFKQNSDFPLFHRVHELAQKNVRIQRREASYNRVRSIQTMALLGAAILGTGSLLFSAPAGFLVSLGAAGGAIAWRVVHYFSDGTAEENRMDMEEMIQTITDFEVLEADAIWNAGLFESYNSVPMNDLSPEPSAPELHILEEIHPVGQRPVPSAPPMGW